MEIILCRKEKYADMMQSEIEHEKSEKKRREEDGCKGCRFNSRDVCYDKEHWINENGDMVCRYSDGAIHLSVRYRSKTNE